MRLRSIRLGLFAMSMALGLAAGALAPSAVAQVHRPGGCHGEVSGLAVACDGVRFTLLNGFDDPATPAKFNKVGVLQVGPERARNVLVLEPGTSAGAGYFKPLADDIVRETHGRWQVWSVDRRENLLEDQSVLTQAKQGKVTPQQFFDFYLGWLANPKITNHFQPVPDSAAAFARGWGMNVEIQDLHRVIEAARHGGRNVVLGGHSLGGAITTAYATWDFNGRPGAKDLSGLVFIDGASGPAPVTAQQATQELQTLQTSTPWLAFGGIPAPFLGLFSIVGSTLAKIDPTGPSILQTFPFLPPALRSPIRVTNEAGFGLSVDTKTSPPSLIAAQVHAGQLAASGDPRGWVRAGAITPIQRYASMLSGTGLTIDGTAWYHPMRLTIDAGAVGDGNVNPAQSVLGVQSIHGDEVKIPMYAFGAALGGQRVLDATRILAQQSGVPGCALRMVNRQSTYAHNDPSAASPDNEFLENLIVFLSKIHHGSVRAFCEPDRVTVR